MEKYIFTFGVGQKNAGYYQPIIAFSSEAARDKMFEVYGNEWSQQYTCEEWDSWVARAEKLGIYVEKELPTIYHHYPTTPNTV